MENEINVNKENWLTSRAMGKLLCVTDERVRQLEDEGVLTSERIRNKKYYDLVTNISAYIEFLRQQAKAKAPAAVADEMAQADLRYKDARASKIELELAELRGIMHRAEDVELITTDMIMAFKAAVLALPGQVAVDAAEARTAAEASAVVGKACHKLLNDMANYHYDAKKYKRQVRERNKLNPEQ